MAANKLHVRGASTSFIMSAVGWAVAISAFGCGQVTPGADAATAVTAAVACADLAQAECAKRVACFDKINATGTGILRVFGTMDECLTREALMCTNGLAAPSTGGSPALTEQCAAAIPGEACADFYAENVPTPCTAKGPGAVGAACVFNGQCSTGYCSGTKSALCGTCAAPPADGAPCAASLCARDQLCDTNTLTCKTPLAAGAACDPTDSACGYELSCPSSAAATTHACEAAVATLGAACGGTMASCDAQQGLYCSGPNGAKTCVKTSYVGDGIQCGTLADGGFSACIAGGCYTDVGLAGAGETGTCKADVTDGAPCDVVLGPGCQLPARCMVAAGSNKGTCTEPTGAGCS